MKLINYLILSHFAYFQITHQFNTILGFSDGSDGKESAYNAGDVGLVPGSGVSPGEGNGKSFQCSCLGNRMNKGAWQATVHGSQKNQTRLRD